MSRAHVAVLQIVSKQLSVTPAAAEYGFSRRQLHRLLVRYREGGLEALEPRSRRPKTTPLATPQHVRKRVIELRRQLAANGLDAGRTRSAGIWSRRVTSRLRRRRAAGF